MITKEQMKEMLKDLADEYNSLTDKIKKYEGLDHWIAADLRAARENIELCIGQLTHDLANLEYDALNIEE